MAPTSDNGKGWGRFGVHTRNGERQESTGNGGHAKPANAQTIIKKLHTAALTKTLVGEDHKPVPESNEPETESETPHLKVAWNAAVKPISVAKIAPQLDMDSALVNMNREQTSSEPSKSSQVPPSGDQLPRTWDQVPPTWLQELTEEHIEAFKQIFDLLDKDHGGFIDVDELNEGLKRVDSQVTREEVETILKQGDIDKSGGITFDEFLYLMSHVDKEEQSSISSDESKKNPKLASLTKRVCLFYSAINRFAKEKPPPTYHLPHVLKHYTAGARLEGLTSRQLNQNLEMLAGSIDEKDKDSPYSKPLNMPPETTKRRSKKEGRAKRKEAWLAREPVVVPDGISRPSAIGHQSSKKTDTKRRKEGNRVIGAAQPGHGTSAGVDKKPKTDVSEDDVIISMQVPDQGQEISPGEELKAANQAGRKEVKYRRGWSWRPPKAAKDKVDAPELFVKYKYHEPTIDDLPGIRKKVKQVMDDYYNRVRQASVARSVKNWGPNVRRGYGGLYRPCLVQVRLPHVLSIQPGRSQHRQSVDSYSTNQRRIQT
ncbi:uncharacterized protein LOC135470767 [Liolophura sinensis]|uniref:uncharacterized protein LOC135470767 n=1 Tax=Liolophura sinensis TaxID=3198878 RepID=UPI003158087C